MDLVDRPVNDRLHVIEEFHRVNHDRLELTVTIDAPKMYARSWIAMNKFPIKLELERYNKLFGNPAGGGDSYAPER